MAVLSNIQCQMECRIVGQLLVDHAPSYALTATLDVILLVEKPEQPFILPATLDYIQLFLKIVGHQGLVDKESDCQRDADTKSMEGVEVPMIQPEPVESTQGTRRTPRATRIPNPDDVFQKKKGKRTAGETSSPIPSLKIQSRQQKPISTTPPPPIEEKILEEDMEKIIEGEDEESYASEFADTVILNEEDSDTRIESDSHKDKPKNIDDDDENKDDKKDDDDDNYDDDQTDRALIRTQRTGSLEIRNENMQTPIPSPPRAPRKDLSSNKDITQEIMVCISPTPATSSQDHSKPTSSKCKIFQGSIAKMSRRREALPGMVNDTVKQDRDSSQAVVPALISQEFVAHAPKIIEEFFRIHMQNTMKIDLQAQDTDPELWDVIKAKFEKTFASAERQQHQQQQQQQEWDAWVEDPVSDEDEVIPEDETPELIEEFQNRNPNKPSRYLYNKDLFFLKYGNTEEKSCVIGDKVHDFQLGIESYQIKINLTAPTLIFLVIEACDPYFIVDEPRLGLIYLNNKEEKRVMDLVEIVKFCDAMLEKVLKEVKLKIFESEFLKKVSLVGDLDLKIMKAYER
ncbi:hypothetical protein Tco_0123141 [Tanacetum coccineum]